jgi:hypothetical protein
MLQLRDVDEQRSGSGFSSQRTQCHPRSQTRRTLVVKLKLCRGGERAGGETQGRAGGTNSEGEGRLGWPRFWPPERHASERRS